MLCNVRDDIVTIKVITGWIMARTSISQPFINLYVSYFSSSGSNGWDKQGNP